MSLKENVRWSDRRTMTRGKVIEKDVAVIPVEALRAWAREIEEIEDPSHAGSCTPESGCDAICVMNASIQRRNHQRKVMRDLLAELEGLE